MTKGYARLRERLKLRPLLYLKRGTDYVGVFCSKCAPGPSALKADGVKASKLSSREVWNYNWKCATCRYPET